ncbi:MAG: putative exported protein, partial [Chthonomonadales bacterium]|nr:putative exported protein [Chthonomonadales bacterium]
MTGRFKLANGLLAAGIVLVFGVATQAQNKMSGANAFQKMATMSAADTKFTAVAAQSGLAEVQMGILAVNEGASAKVKEFGQKMIDDHNKVNNDLKTVVLNKGMTLPEEPNAAQKATLARLSKLHGSAFDTAYIKEMKTDHKND